MSNSATPWTAGFPIHHQLPEPAQTHVHRISDAIQPSHPVSPFSSCLQSSPSIRVFSNESVLHIRWPNYWSFSFNISAFNEYSGLISFRLDWFDLLTVQETLKSLLQQHSSKASVLWRPILWILLIWREQLYVTCSALLACRETSLLVGVGCSLNAERKTEMIKIIETQKIMYQNYLAEFLASCKHPRTWRGALFIIATVFKFIITCYYII